MLLAAARRAGLIVMLAILREGGRETGDKADDRGRNEKFTHQILPRIANA
jgi:hypothetical protein